MYDVGDTVEENEELILNADEDDLVTLSKDLENISFDNTIDLSEYFDKNLELITEITK